MKHQRGINVGMLTAVSMTLLHPGYAQDAPPNAPLPVWKPQPKLMRYLASLTRFSGYAIQPPRGYAMQQTQRVGFAACGWQGNGGRSGVAPGLLLTIGPVPVRGSKKQTSEQLLTASLDAQKRRYTDWTQTAFERGQVNGLVFLRSYWTATQAQAKQKLRGVTYFAVDGGTAIQLTGQDAVRGGKPAGSPDAGTQPEVSGEDPDASSDDMTPAEVDRLQLAETAMHTFHRTGGSKAPARPIVPAPTTP